jgi:hypothetical protein
MLKLFNEDKLYKMWLDHKLMEQDAFTFKALHLVWGRKFEARFYNEQLLIQLARYKADYKEYRMKYVQLLLKHNEHIAILGELPNAHKGITL